MNEAHSELWPKVMTHRTDLKEASKYLKSMETQSSCTYIRSFTLQQDCIQILTTYVHVLILGSYMNTHQHDNGNWSINWPYMKECGDHS